MSDTSSKVAKGGLLMGLAAVITAVVPLFTNDSGERADKADAKAELVLELIKQHLEFLGKEMDELKQNDREQWRIMRRVYMRDAWAAEGSAEEEPAPEPSRPARPRPSSGGGRASGMAMADDPLGGFEDLAMAMEEEEPAIIEKIIEEPEEELPIQQQAPLPDPGKLDELLSQRKSKK